MLEVETSCEGSLASTREDNGSGVGVVGEGVHYDTVFLPHTGQSARAVLSLLGGSDLRLEEGI